MVTKCSWKGKYRRIMAIWSDGNLSAWRGFEDLGDQDLLIAAYGASYNRMATCDNFRGRNRPYHTHCKAPPTLHGARASTALEILSCEDPNRPSAF